MAYDFDSDDRSPPRVEITPFDRDDLAALLVVLEIAAVLLTTDPDAMFSEAELFREARTLVDDPLLSDADLKTALASLESTDSIERVGELLRLK